MLVSGAPVSIFRVRNALPTGSKLTYQLTDDSTGGLVRKDATLSQIPKN